MSEVVEILPELALAAWETLYIVVLSLLVGGTGGLLLGLALYLTRPGNLFSNRPVFTILNVLVNFVRPIPFILLLVVVVPFARLVVGTGIGNPPIIVAISIAAIFGIGRIVEQNLLSVPPGVLEAARAMGASRWRTVWTVLVPEALAPLILGYTYVFVALVDMSAVAGWIGGGGLGTFAIQDGHRQSDYLVIYASVFLIVLIVQFVQFLGNRLNRLVLRR
ncbi:MAG: ABC transporter permease subunit [Pseudoclavibacter sp.]|nr:ABC transporter permease subunit [Pseudoclavibacter sp.]